jgi:erythromycin esterase
MKKITFLLLLSISSSLFPQAFLNLDFEYGIRGTQKPMKWMTGGPGYTVTLDNQEKASHSNSLKMTSNNPAPNSFGVCTGVFPADIARGKEIVFTGKVKTLDVTRGYAGLWWRVDGKNSTLGFDNMFNRGLKGTTDWQQVSIRMKVSEDAVNINFGALFPGWGTAWFDDLQITVDGERFTDLEPRNSGPTPGEILWLKQRIYPLKTCDAGSASDDDLAVLLKLIGNARVVALGETSHGSSEIFRMKHRIIRYLSENAGFDIFSIEANMPESYMISGYVHNGTGDPADLIRGMYFWTWRTQEVLNMVEWMRDHNKSGGSISFTGFDMQYYSGALKELSDAFREQEDIQNMISELGTVLDSVNSERRKSRQTVIPGESRKKIATLSDSLGKVIQNSDLPVYEKNWLKQNLRIIEQYLDVAARDRYMAENLLWIRSQNPDSKIVAWAHNGHIKKTGYSMGKFLSDSLRDDYLTIGFTFNKGTYTAIGNEGLTTYQAQESYPGTFEYFFNAINVPVFLLDLRGIKKQDQPDGRWLADRLLFRSVGAMKTENEFYDTSLTDDYDMIIFIGESTASELLSRE